MFRKSITKVAYTLANLGFFHKSCSNKFSLIPLCLTMRPQWNVPKFYKQNADQMVYLSDLPHGR